MDENVDKKSEISEFSRSHDARLTYISYEPGHHDSQLQQPTRRTESAMPRVSEWNDYPPVRDEWAFQDTPRLDYSRSPQENDLTSTHPLRATPLTIYPPPPHRYVASPYLSSPHLQPSQQLSNDDEQSVQIKVKAKNNVFRMPTPSMRDCVVAVAVCFLVAFLLTIFVAVYFGNNSEPQ